MLPAKTFLFSVCMLLAALSLHAQTGYTRARPPASKEPARLIIAGAYGSIGLSYGSQPLGLKKGLQGTAGIFAEWGQHKFRPGLDVRFAGQGYSLPGFDGPTVGGSASQKLIGPRLEYAAGIFHPYVEGLFGSGSQTDIPQADFYSITNNSHTENDQGFAKFGAIGCDFRADTHVYVRGEYAVGSISSPHAFTIQNASVGLVIRFP